MADRSFSFREETQVLNAATRAAAPGQFVELADGMVHYEVGGPPGRQPVVLLPGLSVPYCIWDPTFQALAEAGFRVLRYDLYGRGYSDRPDTTYDTGLYDRQLLNLLQALDISGPVDLVGLSMGGAIAVVFADRHPESVRKLGLVDPAGLPWQQPMVAKLVTMPMLGEWIMSLLGSKVLISQLEGYFSGPEADAEVVTRFREQMQFVGYRAALLSTLRNGVTTGATDAYRRVGAAEVPVLLIWGREDRIVPFDLSDQVRELIPQAEYHAIEQAAHVPNYERPEAVNPLLIEFLRRPEGHTSEGATTGQ